MICTSAWKTSFRGSRWDREWVARSMYYESLMATSAWLQVFLMGFPFRCIRLTFPTWGNLIYRYKCINYQFQPRIQAKQNVNGFVIPDVNVSSIVSDTFFIFSVCYWGEDEAMESDFNCKSISGRQISSSGACQSPGSSRELRKSLFSSDTFRYQERALSWDSRGSGVKPASWFRQENLENRQF